MSDTRYRLDRHNDVWALRDGTWRQVARAWSSTIGVADADWRADDHTDLIPATRVTELEDENERLAREYNELREVYGQCLAERLEYKGEAERVAELEEQLAEAGRVIGSVRSSAVRADEAWLQAIHGMTGRLDAIHADVRRTDAKAQHIVETVLRLRAREDLAAVMGYELGHDDAKAEVTDAPDGCPTCTGAVRWTGGMVCPTCGTDYGPDAAATSGTRPCDVCERPHPTVEYRPGANGHICRPCANVTVVGPTTGEATA